MTYCNEKQMPCEWAQIGGGCSVSACRKVLFTAGGWPMPTKPPEFVKPPMCGGSNSLRRRYTMSEYIERRVATNEIGYIDTSKPWDDKEDIVEKAIAAIDRIPAADVVPRTAYDQVAWERDVAIEQLREDYGVGLGEKKSADVVAVKHGRWEDYKPPYMGMEYSHDTMVCSECEHIMANALRIPAHYCPNCGAKMGGRC